VKSSPTLQAADIFAAVAAPDEAPLVQQARAFAQPLVGGASLWSGENALAHADGVAEVLRGMGAGHTLQAAAYLAAACPQLSDPLVVMSAAFGEDLAGLGVAAHKLDRLQQQARSAGPTAAPKERDKDRDKEQLERVRRMLLAFSQDLRVVLLRLAQRLQTLRHGAASKQGVPEALARETLQVFAPLANRLGIWQLKWELEDLAFRFLQPDTYKALARELDEKRTEREAYVEQTRSRLEAALAQAGVKAEVVGRPKHLYSIWRKMQGKQLGLSQVLDLRALRVIVADVKDCYAALGLVHALFTPLPEEFDDYIARPKPNGYQSLHTVVADDSPQGRGRPLEVQIRTHAMHQAAEHGGAAHWAYKEAGTKGYAGVSGGTEREQQRVQARMAVVRQLLAWEREVGDGEGGQGERGKLPHAATGDDRIYLLTPQATVVDLPLGATPVDFAYAVHTSLGHRCRGARVDGALVPLNTPLRSGQTVEITAAKEGGPSRDWLNPELGYLQSPRARAKVRAWFNALVHDATVAKGREAVEKLLQREGKTALKLDELAAGLGFANAEALFELVGKDELSLRTIETHLRPPEPTPNLDDVVLKRGPAGQPQAPGKGAVLVVGVDSLLTQMARCCKPAPPDAIGGFVTRGKGVAVHRADCSNFKSLAKRSPERVIDVGWGQAVAQGQAGGAGAPSFAVDLSIEAQDRQGLLRDISEVFAKEKMNVVGVNSQSVKGGGGAGGAAYMTFTVEVTDASRLGRVLALVAEVPGVVSARRR
jgi:GTP pyrophosphokinase